MCIIIVKNAGVQLPSDHVLQSLWNSNRDGGGYCYWEPGATTVVGHKGFNDDKTFVQSLRDHVTKESCALVHMRIGTHGSKNSPAATHPFPASKELKDLCAINWKSNYGIAHNGTITGFGQKISDGLSDTQEFVRDVLSDPLVLVGIFANRPGIIRLVEDDITGDRLAILRADGKIATIGKFYLDEGSGLLYSNEGYKRAKYCDSSDKKKTSRKMAYYKYLIDQEDKAKKQSPQPIDTSAPALCFDGVLEDNEYGEIRDGVWSPSSEGKVPCPSCGRSVYRSQTFRYTHGSFDVVVCPNCSTDVLQDLEEAKALAAKTIENRGKRKDSFELTASDTVARVSFELNRFDGKDPLKGRFVHLDSDKVPLVQRLIKKAKEGTKGKNARWCVRATVDGPGEVNRIIEIYSSGGFYVQDFCGEDMVADKRDMNPLCGEHDILMALLADEFVFCPETNLLLSHVDGMCAGCGHFCGWDSVTGHCGSRAPVMDEERQLQQRVVFGAEVEDIAPHLAMSRGVDREVESAIIVEKKKDVVPALKSCVKDTRWDNDRTSPCKVCKKYICECDKGAPDPKDISATLKHFREGGEHE